MYNSIVKHLEKFSGEIKGTVGRGYLESVDDDYEIQLCKISGKQDEVFDEVEHLHNYGRTYVPPAEYSEVVYVTAGGNSDQTIVVAVDNSINRPTGLAAGEQMLWDIFGNIVYFNDSGIQLSSGEEGEAIEGAARVGDTVVADSDSDPQFFAYLEEVDSFLKKVASSLSLTFPLNPTTLLPTSLTGKITTGSERIKIGGRTV